MSFSSDVTAWARKSQNRLESVFKTAAQDLIEEAQTSTAKGGRMRVDTGFLRNSGQAALNQIPSGTSSPDNMTATALVINRASIGDRIIFGWVAEYAQAREAKDAFMRSAAQNWDKIVFRAARQVEREVNR